MVYGENEGEVFLGRSITTHKNVSEATMQKVDAEIRRIIDQQYGLARKLIEDNRDKVEAMAKALLEWETIDADQINDIMEGRPPRPPKPCIRRAAAAAKQCPDGTQPPRRLQRRAPGEHEFHYGPGRCCPAFVFWGHHACPCLRALPASIVPPPDHGGGQCHARFVLRWRTFCFADQAVLQARRLIEEGADILDIGGESTRPGAVPLLSTRS